MNFYILLFAYLFVPVFLMYLHRKFSIFRQIGSIVMAYAFGILLSLSGISQPSEPSLALSCNGLKTILESVCVPFAIPLMLFSANFAIIKQYWKKIILVFILGIIAVCTAVLSCFLFYKGQNIDELDKVAALMLGFYTGGTPNVAALKMALEPSNECFLLVNTFEVFVTFFLLIALILGFYKIIRKILPYKSNVASNAETLKNSSAQAAQVENYENMLDRRLVKRYLTPLLSTLVIVLLSVLINLWVPANYMVIGIILSISTFSIAASFWKPLKRSPKCFELGMYFILVFSMVVASNFNIAKIDHSYIGILYFISSVLSLSVVLHLVLAKIFRIEGDIFTISMVALIFSPPFVPTVAAAMKNKDCILIGICVGLLGYGIGNYLGISMYLFCNSLLNV